MIAPIASSVTVLALLRAVELVLGGNVHRALTDIWYREPKTVGSARALRRDPFCPPPHPAPPAPAP